MSMVDAINAIAPALDAAIAAAQEAGLEVEGPLASLVEFRNKVKDNQDLVAAAEGLGSVLTALMNTGSLTAESFAALQGQAQSMFDQLTAAGFSSEQALAMMAPYLAQAAKAAEEYGYELDEGTQALVDQADAAGLLDGALGPQERMIELLERQVEATEHLAAAFGYVADEIDDANSSLGDFNHTAGRTPRPPGGGRGGRGHEAARGVVSLGSLPRLQGGGVIAPTPGGTPVIMGEAGKVELGAPVKDMLAYMSAELAKSSGGGVNVQVHVHGPVGVDNFNRMVTDAVIEGIGTKNTRGLRSRMKKEFSL
jgi:hypothetical protein